MKVKFALIVSLVCFVLGFSAAADAKWYFGIGTGISGSYSQGTQGFNITGVGPVKFEVDLSPEDFRDYTDSAFGFGGYATDGKWMIQYKYGKLELQDDPKKIVGMNIISADLSFDITTGELTIGYPLVVEQGSVFRAYTGFRYIKHELDSKLWFNGITLLDNNVDENWTDALIGLSVDVPVAEKWSLSTRFDYGFGGSEGSYFMNSTLSWRFSQHWSTSIGGQYYRIDYENGSKGDKDWYLYDVNEFGFNWNLLFNW